MAPKDPWWWARGRLIFDRVRAQAYSSHQVYANVGDLERMLTEYAQDLIAEIDSMLIPSARCPYPPDEIDRRAQKLGKDVAQWVWERFPRDEMAAN